jgi:hypothetical protein
LIVGYNIEDGLENLRAIFANGKKTLWPPDVKGSRISTERRRFFENLPLLKGGRKL